LYDTSRQVIFTEASRDLVKVDRILLLLTDSILYPPSLTLLQDAIQHDKENDVDRIAPVYSTEAGWDFKTPKTPEIKQFIQSHEAIEYRPKNPKAYQKGNSHEFGAMLEHLLGKLQTVRRGRHWATLRGEPQPEPARRERTV
jgi:hypothetical protein